jgi:hypothetical protein
VQSERQLYTALIVNAEFSWFPEREKSVTPSLPEAVDMLGL